MDRAKDKDRERKRFHFLSAAFPSIFNAILPRSSFLQYLKDCNANTFFNVFSPILRSTATEADVD